MSLLSTLQTLPKYLNGDPALLSSCAVRWLLIFNGLWPFFNELFWLQANSAHFRLPLSILHQLKLTPEIFIWNQQFLSFTYCYWLRSLVECPPALFSPIIAFVMIACPKDSFNLRFSHLWGANLSWWVCKDSCVIIPLSSNWAPCATSRISSNALAWSLSNSVLLKLFFNFGTTVGWRKHAVIFAAVWSLA